MLDIRLFREKGGNPALIRESQRRRYAQTDLVDDVIHLDDQLLKRQHELNELRRVYRTTEGGPQEGVCVRKDRTDEKKEIAEKQSQVDDIRAALFSKLQAIGNLVHDSVPIHKDEANNAVIRYWPERQEKPVLENHVAPVLENHVAPELENHVEPELKNHVDLKLKNHVGRKLKNHVELVELLGLADTKKGANVAGGRGYYLRGYGVLLNQALIQFALNFLVEKGYTAMQPPSFMTKENMARCAQLAQFDEELYKVIGGGEDKYLIATSEQPLCAYHMNDWIHPSELPLRYAGISPCYRKEAGSHGRDTLGIFRVHQFEKVEQFCMTSPNGNDSWEMHEEMIRNSEEFYKMLKLPYRVVNIVSGALNDAAAKKYDLEAWFPASATYRELVSCSNCTDYQSRRLEIRYGQVPQKKEKQNIKHYVHLLNSTLTATERTICCILENYQREEGVEIPEVLRPYMNGKAFLPFLKKMRK